MGKELGGGIRSEPTDCGWNGNGWMNLVELGYF